MNEAARIEDAAHGGTVLASKCAIERLSAEDANSLAMDPDALTYLTVAEFHHQRKGSPGCRLDRGGRTVSQC